MGYLTRILMLSDKEAILNLHESLLAKNHDDEMERMIALWNSRCRPEAIDHYLPMGWSFGCFSEQGEKLEGFFLGQPFLFFEGNTQTLWIEHFQCNNPEVQAQLTEVAVKISREKHFQRVILPNQTEVKEALGAVQSQAWDPKSIWVKTVK